jgi:hypothetical protein
MENKTWLKTGLIAGGTYAFLSTISTILGLIPAMQVINCCLSPIICIMWITFPVATGYLTAMWSNLSKGDTMEAAKQSALAGLILALISGTVSILTGVISTVLGWSTQMDVFSGLQRQGLEIPAYIPMTVGSGVLVTLVSSTVCCLFGIVKDVILSILGGIIYTALKNKN